MALYWRAIGRQGWAQQGHRDKGWPEASACERRVGIYCILSWPLKHLSLWGRKEVGSASAQGSLIKQFPPGTTPAASILPSGASQSPRCAGSPGTLLKLRPLPAGLGAERSRARQTLSEVWPAGRLRTNPPMLGHTGTIQPWGPVPGGGSNNSYSGRGSQEPHVPFIHPARGPVPARGALSGYGRGRAWALV